MKSLLHKAQQTLSNSIFQIPSPNLGTRPSNSTPPAPTPYDILRYRAHHGTNLGSIFVLERWLYPSMFPAGEGNSGGSELDAVTGYAIDLTP